MLTNWKTRLLGDDGAEDTTVVALYEIVRTHGENEEILVPSVSGKDVDDRFRTVCAFARKHDLTGRIFTRRLAA